MFNIGASMRYSKSNLLNEIKIIKSRFTPYGGFTIDRVIVDSHSDSELQVMLNGKNPLVHVGISNLGLCLLDSLTGYPIATLKKVSHIRIAVDNSNN